MARWLNALFVRTMPLVPSFLMWRFAKRYIAGPKLGDAIRTVRDLNARGIRATVDVLGEEVRDVDEAQAFVSAYENALDVIPREKLDCNISIKLTAFGLELDADACRANVESVMQRAKELDIFVRIDMEDSGVTQATLDLFRVLRGEYPRIGVVLQSMLHRSIADAEACATEHVSVRLVKGIYVEPPEVAIQEFQGIRDSFVRVLEILLLQGTAHVGIATHDDFLIDAAKRLIDEHAVPKDRYEFQMLLGVREGVRDTLVAEGHPMRIYVPFGEQWRAYSIRRFKENPQLVGHIMRAALPWTKS